MNKLIAFLLSREFVLYLIVAMAFAMGGMVASVEKAAECYQLLHDKH